MVARLLLALVSLIVLAACGYRADLPVPTRTRFVPFTLPPSWTPAPTMTRGPTRQATKAPPRPTATASPTFPPLVPPTALPPTATLADPARSTINGIVLDALGNPMQNIKVELIDLSTLNQVLQTAISGPDGRFALTRVVPGSYHIQTALVAFKVTKCIATARKTISRGGLRENVILRFASTCR
jgi:hypothetical protein